ncbi:hypothetical protein GQ44DRAFT_436576 [Phaeosphaeriaceae sp. PMI808]|nr:hypothetical protein GQ44DRAFT_436576 [Phaeosphaeriaceae sp. PMI808]
MADDDNFDIDIYGDDTYQDSNAPQQMPIDSNDANANTHGSGSTNKAEGHNQATNEEPMHDSTNGDTQVDHNTQQIASTGGSAGNHEVHKQAPQKQGTKRKQGEDDDRPTDPGATAALMINDVNWWVSEEDIRGWANQSGCEDELIEVTFNEHKVNGKSKGQVYVQLQSPQAATALKHQIDNLFKDQAHAKKPTAIFNPPQHNPFKTLPKDVPQRDKGRSDRSTSGTYGNQTGSFNNSRGNYGRGNFNNRGGNVGYQNNRNFSSPSGGNMGYGTQAPMNNFGGNAMGGGMNNFGGGFNRGGMMGNNMRGGMGNRGGRGGMGMNNMGGGIGMNMPMSNNMMGMSNPMMGMGGNMGMMGGMGGGFNNQSSFSPAFFNQQQQGGNDWGNNPHGAKRPRPE